MAVASLRIASSIKWLGRLILKRKQAAPVNADEAMASPSYFIIRTRLWATSGAADDYRCAIGNNAGMHRLAIVAPSASLRCHRRP